MLVDHRPSIGFMDYHADITAKADEVCNALREKLNARESDLLKVVARSGRLLPKKLFEQAAVIVKAQGLGGNPKLMRRIDMGAINTANSILRRSEMRSMFKNAAKPACCAGLVE
jgi:hypothetical protein